MQFAADFKNANSFAVLGLVFLQIHFLSRLVDCIFLYLPVVLL